MPHGTRLACAVALALSTAAAQAATLDEWPTHFGLDDGTEVSASLNFAYDFNEYSGDPGYGSARQLSDDQGMRRREFGIAIKKKGVYDFSAQMDFQSRLWLDVALRLETRALFGQDRGRVRIGYFKTPVSMESAAASRASSMLELSAASQAVYEGRRVGAEWSLERPRYLLTAAYFFGKDLQGDNPGTTTAGRAVWTPVKEGEHVLHLGFSGSVENRHGYTDGRGTYFGPSARFRARPEGGLTLTRLADSGTLRDVDRVVRTGAEALWIEGPWSVQAEYLRATALRRSGQSDYSAAGYYVTASRVMTGESRPYASGNLANVKPSHGYGAVELLARYGELDLDDGRIAGGHQRDLTFGANWYLTTHFKLQANYVRVLADKGAFSADPNLLEFRAQVQF